MIAGQIPYTLYKLWGGRYYSKGPYPYPAIYKGQGQGGGAP